MRKYVSTDTPISQTRSNFRRRFIEVEIAFSYGSLWLGCLVQFDYVHAAKRAWLPRVALIGPMIA